MLWRVISAKLWLRQHWGAARALAGRGRLDVYSGGRSPRRAFSKVVSWASNDQAPPPAGARRAPGQPQLPVAQQALERTAHSSLVDASRPVCPSSTILVSWPTGDAITGSPLAMYWIAFSRTCFCWSPSTSGASPMSIGSRSDCSPLAVHLTKSSGTPGEAAPARAHYSSLVPWRRHTSASAGSDRLEAAQVDVGADPAEEGRTPPRGAVRVPSTRSAQRMSGTYHQGPSG